MESIVDSKGRSVFTMHNTSMNLGSRTNDTNEHEEFATSRVETLPFVSLGQDAIRSTPRDNYMPLPGNVQFTVAEGYEPKPPP
eukprot:2675702-Amphidinium_carterae.1